MLLREKKFNLLSETNYKGKRIKNIIENIVEEVFMHILLKCGIKAINP